MHINLSNNFDYTTACEWIDSTFPDLSEEELNQFWDENIPLIDTVGQIIALQIAIVTMRNVSGICESNPDYLVELLNQHQREFRESFSEFAEINPNYFF